MGSGLLLSLAVGGRVSRRNANGVQKGCSVTARGVRSKALDVNLGWALGIHNAPHIRVEDVEGHQVLWSQTGQQLCDAVVGLCRREEG